MAMNKKETIVDISKLTKSFLFSAVNHATSDAKSPYHLVKSKYEEWKNEKANNATKDQAKQEKYIITYSNPRIEYESAYTEWVQTRNEIIKQMKNTNIIGEQEKLMSDLLKIPFPEILRTPVQEVYTRYELVA